MVSLSKLLESNGPIDFIVDYVSPVQEFASKKGSMYDAHEVKLKTRSNGEVYTHRMFPSEAVKHKVGDSIRADLDDRGYPVFAKVQSGDPRNNYQEIKKERNMAANRSGMENAEKARNCSIILQAFVKSWVESGVAKTPGEADQLARQQYKLHVKAVADILIGEPEFASETLPGDL